MSADERLLTDGQVAEIRGRSDNGSADWTNPVADARALLADRDARIAEVERLRGVFGQLRQWRDLQAPPDNILRQKGRWVEVSLDELTTVIDEADQ